MEIGGNYSKCNAREAGALVLRVENTSAQSHLSHDTRQRAAMFAAPAPRSSGRRPSRIETGERRAASRDTFQAEFIAQVLGQTMGADTIAANIVTRAYECGHSNAMQPVRIV